MLIYLFSLCFFPVCNKETSKVEKTHSLNVDVVYSWLTHMQQSNGLLLNSEEGKNVSLYDNSLAAIVFSSYGDFHRAEKIFDFFDSRLKSEMLVSPGGFSQMRTIDGNPVDNKPRRWLGDNAWLLIAINNYHHLAKNTKYRHLARAISRWIISLQDADGGLWGGYDVNGNRISKITEGNIDAFNAIGGYTAFHKKLLAYLKNVRWDATDQLLIAWPDYPPYKYALDLHPWGYCIFENFPEAVLTKADRYLTTQLSTATKRKITGYCFDEDKDVIWLEGTGQMAVAFTKAGKEKEAQKYLSQMKQNLVESRWYPGTYALPYSVNYGSSYADDVLWTGVDIHPAVASTAWYLFGLMRFDPLNLGYNKNIPKARQFWNYTN